MIRVYRFEIVLLVASIAIISAAFTYLICTR